jgi:hypothetical protein
VLSCGVSVVMMYSSRVGVVCEVFAIFVAAVLTAPIGLGSAVYSSQTVAPMAGGGVRDMFSFVYVSLRVLDVLDYMFHGSCRKVSKVLSMALEPISKSAVHYLDKRVSEIRVAKEPRYRRCIAVDETKLSVKGVHVYVWSAVDVDSKELLALEASYGRSSLKRPNIPQESIEDVH